MKILPFFCLFRRYVGGLFSNLVIDVGFNLLLSYYSLERKTVVSSTLFLPSGHVFKLIYWGLLLIHFCIDSLTTLLGACKLIDKYIVGLGWDGWMDGWIDGWMDAWIALQNLRL